MPLRSVGMAGLERQGGRAVSTACSALSAGPGRRDQEAREGRSLGGALDTPAEKPIPSWLPSLWPWEAPVLLGAASSSGCKRVRTQAVLGATLFSLPAG